MPESGRSEQGASEDLLPSTSTLDRSLDRALARSLARSPSPSPSPPPKQTNDQSARLLARSPPPPPERASKRRNVLAEDLLPSTSTNSTSTTTLPEGDTFEVIPQKRKSENIEELDVPVSHAEVTCTSRVQEQHVEHVKGASQECTVERAVALQTSMTSTSSMLSSSHFREMLVPLSEAYSKLGELEQLLEDTEDTDGAHAVRLQYEQGKTRVKTLEAAS